MCHIYDYYILVKFLIYKNNINILYNNLVSNNYE